jgi:hypothetical protein
MRAQYTVGVIRPRDGSRLNFARKMTGEFTTETQRPQRQFRVMGSELSIKSATGLSSPFTKWYGHPAREYHGRLGRGNTEIRGKMPLKLMGETPMSRQEPHF